MDNLGLALYKVLTTKTLRASSSRRLSVFFKKHVIGILTAPVILQGQPYKERNLKKVIVIYAGGDDVFNWPLAGCN